MGWGFVDFNLVGIYISVGRILGISANFQEMAIAKFCAGLYTPQAFRNYGDKTKVTTQDIITVFVKSLIIR